MRLWAWGQSHPGKKRERNEDSYLVDPDTGIMAAIRKRKRVVLFKIVEAPTFVAMLARHRRFASAEMGEPGAVMGFKPQRSVILSVVRQQQQSLR